jgi:hypothetical protein
MIGARAHEEAAALHVDTGRTTLPRTHAAVGVPALVESGYLGAQDWLAQEHTGYSDAISFRRVPLVSTRSAHISWHCHVD